MGFIAFLDDDENCQQGVDVGVGVHAAMIWASSAKEKMGKVATTVKEGMDKAKASTQEKVQKVTAHNPIDKVEIAREKKDAKQSEAEMRANAARAEHGAQKEESKKTSHTGAGNIGGGTVGTSGAYDPVPTGRTGRDYVKGSRESECNMARESCIQLIYK